MGQRNIKLTIAYDGTAYHGFQRQANALAIQQVLEEGLASLVGHPVILHGAARTDTGVHAYGQVATFRTTGVIPVGRIALASRGELPPDIVIVAAEEVDHDFHARISAKGKKYLYRLYSGPTANPFLRHYAWHVRDKLDVAAMNQAAQTIVGTHDFSAFRAAGSVKTQPVRTMYSAAVTTVGEAIEFSVTGNGFLYHMVRNFMGTLVEIGRGLRPVSDMAAVLAGKDRFHAGATAPPQGLYLQEVYY